MSETKRLKAFIQYDERGRAIPSSLLLRASKPKGGRFREMVDPSTYKCCPDFRSFSTDTFQMCAGFFGLMIQVTPESEPLVLYGVVAVTPESDPNTITAELNNLFDGFAIFELVPEGGRDYHFNITLIADTYIGIGFYNTTDCSPT